jgi:hypothetical protein
LRSFVVFAALALLGEVTNRLMAQPALWSKPVFLT